jgi:Fur family ferric uptake transcriptional regulator
MSAATGPAPAGRPAAPSGGSRNTRQGDAVLRAVTASTSFRTTQDIHAHLRAAGEQIGLTTVYRHLQILADDGVIDAVKRGDGQVVYRNCATAAHHHHIVCRDCGASVEVDEPAVEDWAKRVAANAGYTDISHTVEIFGICGDCHTAAPD